jgi:ABC-type amino acid transport substrate-binding protein
MFNNRCWVRLGAGMKLNFTAVCAALTLSLAAMVLSACSEAAPAQLMADDSGCVKPETGLIRPESPGIHAEVLTGPFLVKSLSIGVDPANPQQFGSLQWSKAQTWFTVHDFKGPLYLAAEESLVAIEGRSPYSTLYFGCRLD